jgi:hypothetical protein
MWFSLAPVQALSRKDTPHMILAKQIRTDGGTTKHLTTLQASDRRRTFMTAHARSFTASCIVVLLKLAEGRYVAPTGLGRAYNCITKGNNGKN